MKLIFRHYHSIVILPITFNFFFEWLTTFWRKITLTVLTRKKWCQANKNIKMEFKNTVYKHIYGSFLYPLGGPLFAAYNQFRTLSQWKNHFLKPLEKRWGSRGKGFGLATTSRNMSQRRMLRNLPKRQLRLLKNFWMHSLLTVKMILIARKRQKGSPRCTTNSLWLEGTKKDLIIQLFPMIAKAVMMEC